jgi:hypothetical protein
MKATEKLTHEQMRVLKEAARPLWCALEDLAWVDGHGGAEFDRVFPDMLDFLHREANPLVYEGAV